MNNANGKIVLEALRRLDGPASLDEISAIVAVKTGLRISDVRAIVQKTLAGGVTFGYVGQKDQRYFLCDTTGAFKNPQMIEKMRERCKERMVAARKIWEEKRAQIRSSNQRR